MRVATSAIPSLERAPTVCVRSAGAFAFVSTTVKSLKRIGMRTEKRPSVDSASIQPVASGSPACWRCIFISCAAAAPASSEHSSSERDAMAS